MLFLIFFYILLVNTVKGIDIQLEFTNNTAIGDPNYCKSRNCILKCCPVGKVIANLRKNGVGVDKCVVPKYANVKKAANYTKIKLYTVNSLKETNMSAESEFTFVYNRDFFNDSMRTGIGAKVLEDGSLNLNGHTERKKTFEFCIDFLHTRKKIDKNTTLYGAEFTYRIVQDPMDEHAEIKHIFVATGLLTSCFFMILVIFVYALLPTIRGGLHGVILMMYLIAVTLNFVLKAYQLIALHNNSIDAKGCLRLTPWIYYFILANFFWSNILTYDMWNNIANIKNRQTLMPRKSVGQLVFNEKKKMAYYSLYACGIPAVITTGVILVHINGWYTNINYKPPFEDCFYNKSSEMLYVNVPIGIMTTLNCILFIRTISYIWAVHGKIKDLNAKKNVKNRRHVYTLYMKISALMGVSWLLELIPSDIDLVPYILVSFYNIFIGLIIFFVLLWRKKVLIELFIRFDIMQEYVTKHKESSSFKHSSNRTVSRSRSCDEQQKSEVESLA